MSGDNIKVGFSSVESIESQLGSTLKKLQTCLSNLDNSLKPIHDSWSGAAKAAYANDKVKWDKAADDMNIVLGQITKAVTDAKESYVKVSAQTSRMFGS